jgi:hypothetical protein
VNAPKVVDGLLGCGSPREIEGCEGTPVQLGNLAQLAERRFNMMLLALFGVLGLSIASVGFTA